VTAALRRLEAIEEIRRLKALYCHWADRGYESAGDDAKRFAELFADDAVWSGGNGVPVVGRARIEERFATVRPFSFHFATNGIIDVDVDAGRATARWSVLAPATTQDGRALWIAGTYDDALVQTPTGWLFERVTFTAAFRTPYDEGWAETPFVG
jgi:ketosteroid isomerase-like protein